MSQQYRRVNLSEMNRCLEVMEPGKDYTSDLIAELAEMEWMRTCFAMRRAESKGLVLIYRPKYRLRNDRNIYRRVTK